MGRILSVLVLNAMAIAQLAVAGTTSQHNQATPPASTSDASSTLPALPPAPPGKSTVIGGAIRDVDPVRDQLTLKVFGGGRPMKILFDARTQVYLDGKRTPIRDLHPEAHASIQTVLDGAKIYALSIHILSQSPEGECQCQVLNYDPGTGELTLRAAMSRQPIKLRVPPGTPVTRPGQTATSTPDSGPSDTANPVSLASLVKGTLVSVQFASGSDGRGVARRISVLATPGSPAIFSGSIGFLDLHAALLAVVDPRDGKSYTISFDPARFPVSRDLRRGTQVTVTATFDGVRYVADTIEVKK